MKRLLTLMLMAVLSITICACSINQESQETTTPSETEVKWWNEEDSTDETEVPKTENEILLSNYIAKLKQNEKKWIIYDVLISKSDEDPDEDESVPIQTILQRDEMGNVMYQTLSEEGLIPEKSFYAYADSNGFYGFGENNEEIVCYDICTVHNIIEAQNVMPKEKYITYLNNMIQNNELETIQSEEAEFHGKNCKMLTLTINSNYFNFVNPSAMNFIYESFVEQFGIVPADKGTPTELNLYFDKDSIECLGQRIKGPYFLYQFALGDKELEEQLTKKIDYVIDMQFMDPVAVEIKDENKQNKKADPHTFKMLMEDTLSVDAEGEYIQIDTNYDIVMALIQRGLMICQNGDQIANLYPMYYRSLFYDALTDSKTNKLFKIEQEELDIPGKRASLLTYITEQESVYSYVLVVSNENDPMGIALVGANKEDLINIAKDVNLKTFFKEEKQYFDLMPFAEPTNDLTEELDINKEVSEVDRENKGADSVSIEVLINELKEYAKKETFDYIFANQVFEGHDVRGATFRRVMDENGTFVILGQFENNTRASINVPNGKRYIHYVTADIANPKWEQAYRINESNGSIKTAVNKEHLEMLDKLNGEKRLTLLDEIETFKGVDCHVITTKVTEEEYAKIEPTWGYYTDFFVDTNEENITLKIYFSQQTHQLIGEVETINYLNDEKQESRFVCEYVYYPDPDIIDIPDFVQYEDE